MSNKITGKKEINNLNNNNNNIIILMNDIVGDTPNFVSLFSGNGGVLS